MFEPATASSEVPPRPGVSGASKGVLLDSSVRKRSGISWYLPARMQLLAAPEQDGVSTAPAWSALVLDGVAVPYDEVEWVRTDESVREFIIMEHRPCPKTQEKKYTQTHVRMFTRSEFNLWREALDPKMSNSTLYAHTESKMPAVYASAQKWLVNEEMDNSSSSSSAQKWLVNEEVDHSSSSVEAVSSSSDNASTGAAVIGEELADRARAALKIQSVLRGQAKRAEYVRDKEARRQWVARYIAVNKYGDATKTGWEGVELPSLTEEASPPTRQMEGSLQADAAARKETWQAKQLPGQERRAQSFARLQQRQIVARALQAPSWSEQESQDSRANAEPSVSRWSHPGF